MVEFLNHVLTLASLAMSLTMLGPGTLAAADPLVLERVEMRRLRNGWGLDGLAGPGVAKLAVEDCRFLGWDGLLVVEGMGAFDARVVDCQNGDHLGCCRMSDRGLLADVGQAGLGHRKATLILWK